MFVIMGNELGGSASIMGDAYFTSWEHVETTFLGFLKRLEGCGWDVLITRPTHARARINNSEFIYSIVKLKKHQ